MARNMSAASTAPRAKGQIHREKTLYEAWTSDVGVSFLLITDPTLFAFYCHF